MRPPIDHEASRQQELAAPGPKQRRQAASEALTTRPQRGPPTGPGDHAAAARPRLHDHRDPAAVRHTLVISFMNWNAYYPDERGFAGIDNFRRVLTDPNPASAIWVTIELTAVVVVLRLVLGLVHRAAAGPHVPRPRHRADDDDHPVPHRAGGGGAAVEARALQPGVRPAQRHCSTASASSSARTTRRSPTGSPTTRWAAIIVALVWQWTPFMMLILLAGLQSRPLDVIEAARIDGASSRGRSSRT